STAAIPAGTSATTSTLCCGRTSSRASSGGGLRPVEVQLHLRAHRVVAEDLPQVRADLLAEAVGDVVRFEARDGALQIARRESDMVDHAGAIAGQFRRGYVQDRPPARVEPQAVEAERRAITFLESQDA